MKTRPTSSLVLALLLLAAGDVRPEIGRSRLSSTEPGAIDIEDLLPKPIKVTVAKESTIFYQGDMQRPLGSMAAGTVVQLVAMTDNAWKVRGRARHGDVAGWMHIADLHSPDPKLAEKLKAFSERQKTVEELVQKHQIAIGMTAEEVKASLGQPTRKSARITAGEREETLEYSVFKTVPQSVPGRDAFGNLVQNIVYVKVETGRLTISLKAGTVTEIQETQGANPVPGGAVKIVPGPVIVN